MEQNQNYRLVILAIIISIIMFVLWDTFFLKPLRDTNQEATNTQSNQSLASYLIPSSGSAPTSNEAFIQTVEEATLLKEKSRVVIHNNNFIGSINLKGARLDNAILTRYKESVNKNSENIVLLHPKETSNSYFYESGFISNNKSIDFPNNNTLWSADKTTFTVNSPVTLTYTNKQGIVFKKIISIDNNYMLKITDQIINNNNKEIEIYPWAFIVRHGEPIINDMFISHEGIVGYLNSGLEQIKYKEVKNKNILTYNKNNYFFGFSDKNFMVSLLPTVENTANFRYFTSNDGIGNYQVDYIGKMTILQHKQTFSNTTNVFVGPKSYNLLHDYGNQYKIPKFEDSIDFGWFHFITKPFLKVLLYFYGHLHNFGYAMLCFTILIRLCVFPITYMSFASMAKMKKIQPKLVDLKAKYGKDMQKYNKSVMELYRKEKVNPLAGCLPLIIQIPILFSIYKVIYISIDMRHAPFWWIKDLSAPDPSSIFNLFGLLPYSLPSFLHIGFWAILMGITMFLQQRLSGATSMNETQRRIMNWFPVIITVVLAGFPAGLLIYWCWSNIISVVQQVVINKIVNKRHFKK